MNLNSCPAEVHHLEEGPACKKRTCPSNIRWEVNTTFVCSDTVPNTQNVHERPAQESRNLPSDRWFCSAMGSWPNLISCLPPLCTSTTLEFFQFLEHGSLFPPQPFPDSHLPFLRTSAYTSFPKEAFSDYLCPL